MELSKGKEVLDLCCYTGGFAIYAAKGGAARVTGKRKFGNFIIIYSFFFFFFFFY